MKRENTINHYQYLLLSISPSILPSLLSIYISRPPSRFHLLSLFHPGCNSSIVLIISPLHLLSASLSLPPKSQKDSQIMARIKEWVEKLEVPSEPGLTNTQLMLTNHDLRPGEII